MAYKVEINKRWDYIEVVISGKWMPGAETNDAISALKPLTESCIKYGIFSVLCYIKIKGQLPMMSSYELVEKKDTYNWDDRIKIAWVFDDQKLYEDNKTTETIAVNRGMNSKVFNDEKLAKKWLFN